MSFPNDWIIAEVGDESREWMDRWADPEQLSDTLLMAQHRGEYQCSFIGDTRFAEADPAFTSLAEWIDEEAYWVKQDPTVADFEAAYLDLTAGRTATLDVLHDDGTDSREYLFTDRTTWFRLSCSSTDPPDDRWLSIAETFEFLPDEA